ncbi:hypothetical protein Nepgr_024236 [Nepenthes gracilis]|uniref:RING-type domain-containing protein n=1 Tax=Nepenthes gracilis TaxID=150966 RepID=A0AAD3XYL4_NEPGR|nr:hypothetical protein Nepgr_024236 [Nepenthes gracilis]
MTKSLASTKPLMELDLDSFLRRHNVTSSSAHSDNDDVELPVPHRTVDDILNDSSSSSPSSSPTSSFRSSFLRPDSTLADPDSLSAPNADSCKSDSPKSRDDNVVLVPTPKTQVPTAKSPNSNDKTAQLDGNSVLSKHNLVERFKSDEFYAFSNRRQSSRPLPSLFGGARSSTKPGAALAAAAAASRSIPTPYAAAIKSRRAISVNLDSKVSDGDELFGLGTSYDVSNAISENSAQANAKSENGNDPIGEFHSAFVVGKAVSSVSAELPGGDRSEKSENDCVESSKETCDEKEADGSAIGEFENVKSNKIVATWNSNAETETTAGGHDGDLNLDDPSARSGSDIVMSEHATSTRFVDWDIVDFLDSKVSNADDSAEKEFESEMDQRVDEDSKSWAFESQDVQKIGTDSEAEELGPDRYNSISISDDVTELVEDRLAQLESERAAKRTDKKLLPSKKPLELAEELEKKQASTGLHWEEGAAAQPMRLEGVRRGSTALGYFDIDADNTVTRIISSQAFRRDHGSAQALAVHQNYIALGMSKGVVIVVPSKYSVYHPDNMDAKMSMLGLHGDRSQVPVTSIRFNQQGDLLLAGYGDGHVALWDVPRASTVKVITGEHTAPVVHVFFLGQDSQATRQFRAITGDSKGLVRLHAISVMPLIGRYTIETRCIFDGQNTGTVLCASPLLPDEFIENASVTSHGGATGGKVGGVVGGYAAWKLFNEGSSLSEEGVAIFVGHQTAVVVRLTPTMDFYARFPKPDGVREGSMPYIAWKCTTHSRSSSTENMHAEVSEKISLLAIAWDRKVQVAKLLKPELKVYCKWTLDSAAVGLTWLNDQMLVVLTLTGHLCLFARDGTLIHQTSYDVGGSGRDDLMAYHTHFTNIFGNPEKAYHNCLAVRGASVYILGPIHLVVSRLLPWKERIQVLRKAGDWMGALNMAITLYDGQAHGVIDLPKTLDAIQDAVMPYLVELLISYVDEVFSYISVACFNQIEKVEQVDVSRTTGSSTHYEIKEQFIRVGGVAVEFCVHIKRTDILFDEIFSKFVAVRQNDTFLELLEPYILKDMLGSLPPEIMQALVEHYNSKGWLHRVEQCVLHMDISSLDFNQVVRLCREHGLYGALIYLFNKGLDDFRTPLEELLAVLQSSERDAATALGYRMLIYLKYCFLGLAFPPGHDTLPPERLPSLIMELLQFLLEDSGVSKSRTVTSSISTGAFLNLYYLLELDVEATLDVLRFAFVEHETLKIEESLDDSSESIVRTAKENGPIKESQNLLLQKTIDALVLILDIDISHTVRSAGSDESVSVGWPSKKDIGFLIEFIACYVASERATVSKSVLSQILEYLTSENSILPSGSNEKNESTKKRQKQVLALLDVVPETHWNASYVLHLCEKAQFYQVCGLIHTIRHEYIAALDSYMKDVNEPVHAFSFINSELLRLSETESATFRSAVISRIPELTELSRVCTFFMVIDHFNKESGHILFELRSHPKSLFLYLKTIIEVHLSGTLDFSCLRKDDLVNDPSQRRLKDQRNGLEAYFDRISDFPKLIRSNEVEVTDEMIELYLELLCQFEPDSVLKFLETFESYRVEHCLRLCQEYGIVDAAAFLLERVGDVGSAILLTLSALDNKFTMLDAAVGDIASDFAARDANIECFDAAVELKEVKEINKILHVCVGLCQRNTSRLDPVESESLWFLLLDSFCKPLMLYDGQCEDKKFSEALSSKDGKETVVSWRISKAHKSAPILKRLFAQFIKEIVEGMIGYIRLPSIMSKLLSDNSSQEFGDFKLTILGMLGTYGFERRILDTAKSLIEDDTFYTMSILKKGASHGYALRSLLCCICNCPFNKISSPSGIRVFSCGHAAHLHCELQENDASSQISSTGCPICVPKKKIQNSRNKMVEQGLINRSPSRRQQSHGSTVQHTHESDAFENSCGLHQISRFEILSNLQKNQGIIQIESMPPLRLAPPAIYHEKVSKGAYLSVGESSRSPSAAEMASQGKQVGKAKGKGSSVHFPLKSKIFGKEKSHRR